MPIAPSEIQMFLSGGASNSSASSSLGGVKSSTAAPAAVFDDVTAAEASAGRTEYRCLYVANADPSLTLAGAVVTVQADSSSAGTVLAVGVGTSAANTAEQSVANETTAPNGVTFGTSTTLGDIPGGGFRAFWERRIVSAGAAAVTTDAATLRVSGSYTE